MQICRAEVLVVAAVAVVLVARTLVLGVRAPRVERSEQALLSCLWLW